MAVIDSRLETDGRTPVRVPLSAIFKPGAGTQQGLSRQAPLRAMANGDGE